MDFTLAGVRAFVEVFERRSIREAAESLGYTPSAISQRLAALEDRLGLELFERLGSSIRATDSGRRLHPRALELLAAVEVFSIGAGEIGGQRRPVTLGGFPSGIGIAVLPALGQLEALEIDVRLVSVEDAQGQKDLRLGTLDLLLLQEYVVEVPRQPDFSYEEVLSEPLALVSSHRIRSLREAAGESWVIANEKTVCGHGVRDLCRQAGFAPDVVADIEDFGLQLELVASGLGVAILPRSAITPQISDDLWVEEVPGAGRRILAATRTSSKTDATIMQCLSAIASHRPGH